MLLADRSSAVRQQAGAGLLVAQVALALVGAGAIAGFVASVWYQRSDGTSPMSWGTISVAIAVGGAAALTAARLPSTAVSSFLDRIGRLPGGIAAAVVVGVVLRLLLALALAPQPASDGATYLALASRLAEGDAYVSDGRLAYWPPGLPLALAPLLWIGLPKPVAVLALGLGAFIVAALGLARVVASAGRPERASAAVWVLALWPPYVLCAGLPEKELLVVALMPWIVDRAIAAYRGSLGAAVTAGVLTGLAVLVQPSLQLLPVAGALLALLLCRRHGLRVVVMLVAAILAMVAVVTPWTVRNVVTLGVPVFVSTNGGDVLYRANNELATGAYRPSGAVDLRHLDELSLDRESKRLAVEWITSNPAGFVQLGAAKALMFLGEDSYGAYAVFQRGKVEVGRTTYLVIKAATALPWLVLWCATLALALQRRNWERHVDADALAFVVLPVVYLLVIHSVFESGPKYHFPVLALAIAAFAIVSPSTADRSRRSRPAARQSETAA
ncbi:MAG: hypothetical protein HXY24_05020 [Rubrivivax sp.]|nr:hypothetical protein [Rubrivivax sp.]